MGYSRAVQAGPTIHVSGCVGILPDGTYAEGLAAQSRRCLERIDEALAALGAAREQVVRVRIYTTCIARWEEIASVLGPAFEASRPANVLVEVSALVDSQALVEIEAEAWTG
jgi:enamine deaminase RidA (YjgF/YER057c/UK114 family)